MRVILFLLPLISFGLSEDASGSSSLESFQKSLKSFFKTTREKHHEAIKQLLQTEEFERQVKMITAILDRLQEGLDKAHAELINYHSASDIIEAALLNKELQSTFAMVMETTAFNGDLALHFPDIYHQLYDTNSEFQEIVKWAIKLVNESNLYDETSQRMINLVSQELNIISREENFFNPFAKKNKRKSQVVQEQPKPKEKKKKKRGPGLSGSKIDL